MKNLYRLIVLLPIVLLAACATPQNNYDPLESMNRKVYGFNDTVDRYALKPVAKGYRNYTPQFVQSGVGNFFGNISDLFAIPPALLQGKLFESEANLIRVLVNTTVGVGGLFDVAGKMDIPKSEADYGQALAKAGVGSGPYLVLPFLGPSSARDTINPAASFLINGPTTWIDDWGGKAAYFGVSAIHIRSQLLPLEQMLADQPDPYAYMRDAWLQRRWNQVHDGDPPHPLPFGDPEEELPAEDAAPAAQQP
jgi:phospholipid-binding lipoprotein MlaA